MGRGVGCGWECKGAAVGASQSASATFPKSVISVGGRFGYKDQGQTANTQISVMDYGDTQLIFEVVGRPTGPLHGSPLGTIAHLVNEALLTAIPQALLPMDNPLLTFDNIPIISMVLRAYIDKYFYYFFHKKSAFGY